MLPLATKVKKMLSCYETGRVKPGMHGLRSIYVSEEKPMLGLI
jgi:hypothetical protein